jgi:hypothetical protein
MRAIARIHTLGIILRRPHPLAERVRKPKGALDISAGSPATLAEIVSFLRTHGANKQFYPAYDVSDFYPASLTTRGFQIEDFAVARKGAEIVGLVGLWDQSGYKQTRVQSYSKTLTRLRPLYNLFARILGVQPLPGVGQHIHSAYASFICVRDNDPLVFRTLLGHIYRLAAKRGYAHLMVGLSARDPLLPVARQFPHIAYHSTLYLAAWQAIDTLCDRLDGRVPYVEIAAL